MTGDGMATLVHDKLSGEPDADLGELAAEVIRCCLGRNSRDNITCMIAQFTDGSEWTSVSDEMKGYEKLLDTNGLVDEDVKKQYNTFLRKCKFPPEPCVCSVSRRWMLEMYQCPCKQVYYSSRACQKKDWKAHKAVCPLVNKK